MGALTGADSGRSLLYRPGFYANEKTLGKMRLFVNRDVRPKDGSRSVFLQVIVRAHAVKAWEATPSAELMVKATKEADMFCA